MACAVNGTFPPQPKCTHTDTHAPRRLSSSVRAALCRFEVEIDDLELGRIILVALLLPEVDDTADFEKCSPEVKSTI